MSTELEYIGIILFETISLMIDLKSLYNLMRVIEYVYIH